jgi:hypothetical protein
MEGKKSLRHSLKNFCYISYSVLQGPNCLSRAMSVKRNYKVGYGEVNVSYVLLLTDLWSLQLIRLFGNKKTIMFADTIVSSTVTPNREV